MADLPGCTTPDGAAMRKAAILQSANSMELQGNPAPRRSLPRKSGCSAGPSRNQNPLACAIEKPMLEHA